MQTRSATEELALRMFYLANRENGLFPPEYSFEQAEQDLSTRQILPILHNNQPVGAFIQQGPELHLAVRAYVKKRWLTFGYLDQAFNRTIEEYGYVCTKAPLVWPKRVVTIPNLQRSGFVEWKRDRHYIWYWMTRP